MNGTVGKAALYRPDPNGDVLSKEYYLEKYLMGTRDLLF